MDASGQVPTAEPTARTGTRRRLLGFGRNRKGSVAIEFTMLVLPFSLLVFAIFETGISFAGQQLLANVTDDVARQYRTGQIKPTDLTHDQLKKRICDRLEIVVSAGCPGLEVDLRQYATFADAAKERIRFTPDGDIDTTGFRVTPGQSMSKNMLRVYYRWPVITDFLRKGMSNLKDGKTLHFATATWQNEPFDD